MWNLLPSRENNRFLVCKACGGHYDLSNNCRMTSILGGMVGMALGMAFPFQWIVKAGHASKGSIVLGIAVAALSIGVRLHDRGPADAVARSEALSVAPRRRPLSRSACNYFWLVSFGISSTFILQVGTVNSLD